MWLKMENKISFKRLLCLHSFMMCFLKDSLCIQICKVNSKTSFTQSPVVVAFSSNYLKNIQYVSEFYGRLGLNYECHRALKLKFSKLLEFLSKAVLEFLWSMRSWLYSSWRVCVAFLSRFSSIVYIYLYLVQIARDSELSIMVFRTRPNWKVRSWKPGTGMKVGFLSLKNRIFC